MEWRGQGAYTQHQLPTSALFPLVLSSIRALYSFLDTTLEDICLHTFSYKNILHLNIFDFCTCTFCSDFQNFSSEEMDQEMVVCQRPNNSESAFFFQEASSSSTESIWGGFVVAPNGRPSSSSFQKSGKKYSSWKAAGLCCSKPCSCWSATGEGRERTFYPTIWEFDRLPF